MKYFSIIVAFFIIFGGNLAIAQQGGNVTQGDCPAGTKCLPNPLNTTNTIFDLVKKVIDWLINSLAPIVATVMVIIGAFQMLLAKGDPKQFDTGKKTVLYTVLGYAILLLGWSLTAIVGDFLNVK